MAQDPQSPTRESRTNQSSRPQRILATISASVALIAALVTTFIFPPPKSSLEQLDSIIQSAADSKVSRFESELARFSDRLDKTEASLSTLSGSSNGRKGSPQFEQMHSSIKEMKASLSKLNEVILDNPSKALEVTLLRKDLENLQKNYQSDLISLRREAERVYDLTKWFLGLMFTIALSIIGLAVSIFLKGK